MSYSTLDACTVEALNRLPNGVVVCSYTYNPADAVEDQQAQANTQTQASITQTKASPSTLTSSSFSSAGTGAGSGPGQHVFYAIGWKGYSRTMNVMCGKVGE